MSEVGLDKRIEKKNQGIISVYEFDAVGRLAITTTTT